MNKLFHLPYEILYLSNINIYIYDGDDHNYNNEGFHCQPEMNLQL